MKNRIALPSGITFSVITVALSMAGAASAADRMVPKQYSTIQAAINASSAGDTISVAPGTYNELIRFNGKAVTVHSTGSAADTIIDGGQLGTTVKCVNGEGAASVLEGFTIRNGKAAVGGGMYLNSASPTIRNCVISGNTALDRGAGAAVINGTPTFTSCTFSSNTATERGGAVYLMVNSDVVFTQCTFTSNATRNRNGESYGGAVAAENAADPTFNYCTLDTNKA
jgi:predicted outer membrane repeat protein